MKILWINVSKDLGWHNIHVLKKTTLTVGKKSLVLVLPFLGSVSLETRTKLNKPLKSIVVHTNPYGRSPNCVKRMFIAQN